MEIASPPQLDRRERARDAVDYIIVVFAQVRLLGALCTKVNILITPTR